MVVRLDAFLKVEGHLAFLDEHHLEVGHLGLLVHLVHQDAYLLEEDRLAFLEEVHLDVAAYLGSHLMASTRVEADYSSAMVAPVFTVVEVDHGFVKD